MSSARQPEEPFDISKLFGENDDLSFLSGFGESSQSPSSQNSAPASNADWFIEDQDPHEGEYERFVIRNGQYGSLRFDARTNRDLLRINWEAQIPQSLQKGSPNPEDWEKQARNLGNKFLPLIFFGLPNRLGLYKTSYQDTQQYYRKTTEVELGYSGGREGRFRFAEDAALMAFAVNFVARGKDVKTLRVFGGKQSAALSDYILTVNYPGDSDDRAGGISDRTEGMSLWLPVSERGLAGCSRDIALWLFDAHRSRAELGQGNLNLAADSFAQVLRDKTQAALDRAKGRS